MAGMGAGAIAANKRGSYSIPEGGGRSTQIRTSADGGMIIIRGGDSARFIVTPDGTVRSLGRKNKSTRVTTSSDGRRVTIWGRDGRTYTVPMPED